MEIRDKVALVTGSGRRVGRVIATALASRGCHLLLHYRTAAAEAGALAAEAARLGVKAVPAQADLADPAAAASLVRTAEEAFGRLDILVNNAAVFTRTPLGEVTAAAWDALFAVNLRAPFLLAQAAAPLMARGGGGRIVNLADISAERPWADYIPYCTSKASLIALTRGLAKALAPNILVNAIAPGTVLWPEDYPAEAREREIRRTPLRRTGTPEDVARAVLFLLEGADFVTGQILALDGGRALT
ncbi:MAG: SDR family oxidoreductase [candidate division NC10 bacterium]|nr:SDR family oxidoreductase [candidate division NC10 bacterium]